MRKNLLIINKYIYLYQSYTFIQYSCRSLWIIIMNLDHIIQITQYHTCGFLNIINKKIMIVLKRLY